MSLKIFKPYTKSTRGTVIVARENLWKGKPIKTLIRGKKSSSGRNNLGRITSRRRGVGHKQKYREIDFHRNKLDMEAEIERIESNCFKKTDCKLKMKSLFEFNKYIICLTNLLQSWKTIMSLY